MGFGCGDGVSPLLLPFCEGGTLIHGWGGGEEGEKRRRFLPHTVAAIVHPAGTLVSAASMTLRARLAESDPLNSSPLLLPIVSTASPPPLLLDLRATNSGYVCKQKAAAGEGIPFFSSQVAAAADENLSPPPPPPPLLFSLQLAFLRYRPLFLGGGGRR